MTFDPAKVDMSYVEPALRDEVLQRIVVLERYLASRGRAAEMQACRDLNLSRHQLYVLARTWTVRRRAEDVTLRATKRHKPSTLDPEVVAMIGSAADMMPGATIRQIETEVVRRAEEAGLRPPTYPTVNKYVRERAHARRAEVFAKVEEDLVLDVIVSDLPVRHETGERIRPHVLLCLTRSPEVWPASLSVTTGEILPADLAEVIAAVGGTAESERECRDHRRSFIVVSIPAGILDARGEAELRAAGILTETRTGELATPGRLATAALGTSLAGYKLRPKLVGATLAKRAAGYPRLGGSTAAEAADYLLTTAREGRSRAEPAPSAAAFLASPVDARFPQPVESSDAQSALAA